MQWSLGRRSMAVLLVGTAFLTGCAHVSRQAFNAQGAGSVRTIALAQPENQTEYPATVVGHPGMSFGLIGGLIAAADMQNKTSKLTAAIDPREVRLQERFAQQLRKRLDDEGYQTVVVVLPPGTSEADSLARAKQQANCDAVVVLKVNGGYVAAGPTTDYLPLVFAKVRTVDARSDKVLYEDTITYGYGNPRSEVVHLDSDAKYRFGSIDALVADPAKTRDGLYAGVDAVTQQIANDLKKN